MNYSKHTQNSRPTGVECRWNSYAIQSTNFDLGFAIHGQGYR